MNLQRIQDRLDYMENKNRQAANGLWGFVLLAVVVAALAICL